MNNVSSKKEFDNRNWSMQQITPYLFIFPAFVAILALFVYPLLYGLGISFFQTNLISKWDFVGIKNYTNFLTNPEFINSFWITARFCAIVVSFHFIIGTAFAMSLNNPKKLTPIFRTILILPWVFPEVVIALIFKWILNPVYGILNTFLLSTGLIEQSISWLGSSTYAFTAVVMVCIWKGYPMVMINVLAALQSVPDDIYEAAKVDGANRMQTFFKITVPSIKPVLTTIVILDTIWWFKHYTMISLLTSGGPNNSTSIISVEIYKNAFTYFDFGTAAAMSVVVFVICFGISKCYRRFFDEKDD